MRSLILFVVLAAQGAQALSASGDLTFSVTTPLPVTSAGTQIEGGGTVTLGCSPCANPSNTQKYIFAAVQFVYAQSPGEMSNRVAGLTVASTQTSYPYTTTQLKAGTRVFPRLRGVSCVCGNGAETAMPIDIDKPAFTVNPYLNAPTIIYDANDALRSYPISEVPAGKASRIKPLCGAVPKGSESLRFRLTGAGVDVTQEFATPDAAQTAGIVFTPTAAGDVSVTCTLLPYDAVSNVLTLKVIDAGGGAGGGSGGSGGAAGGSGGGGAPEGGCTHASGLAVVLAGLCLCVAQKRRRGLR